MDSIIFSLHIDDGLLLHEVRTQLALNYRLNNHIDVGNLHSQVFSDGEVCTDFITSVRGKRVYILSSPNNSDKLVQLNMAIDAAKRAAAKEIIPIIPYFPYARQDKKDQVRGPIGAKVVAEMLENRGATSIITFDLHADQIQGFFNIPVTHMEGKFLFTRKLNELYLESGGNLVLCSPDAGGAKRVKGVRDRLKDKYDIDIPMVMIDKTRSEANKVDEMVLIGNVEGKDVVIVDDMADTCGTLIKASENLLEKGAKSVRSIVTHGVLSGPALDRLYDAIADPRSPNVLTEFICSDTLQLPNREVFVEQGAYVQPSSFITVVSTAPQILKAIQAIDLNVSVEDLKKK
jgi:ribose-phosphate pyrophosphokinase